MPSFQAAQTRAAMENLALIDNVVATASAIDAKGIVAVLGSVLAAQHLLRKSALRLVTGRLAKGFPAITDPLVEAPFNLAGCQDALASVETGIHSSIAIILRDRTKVDGKGAVATRESVLALAVGRRVKNDSKE